MTRYVVEQVARIAFTGFEHDEALPFAWLSYESPDLLGMSRLDCLFLAFHVQISL